jgi:hypothetical protein
MIVLTYANAIPIARHSDLLGLVLHSYLGGALLGSHAGDAPQSPAVRIELLR